MLTQTKRCLFCEQTAEAEVTEEEIRFSRCICCPEGSYLITRQALEYLTDLPIHEQRGRFYLISGYIRECSEETPEVRIDEENVDSIHVSPMVPVTLDEKMDKCLHYLYRACNGTSKTVELKHRGASFNITYSPNQQEFIYILEELKTRKLIERFGFRLQLTPKGIQEAKELYGGKRLLPCLVVMAETGPFPQGFHGQLAMTLQECGYKASSLLIESNGSFEKINEQEPESAFIKDQMEQAELVLFDFTLPSPDSYYSAGLARGLGCKTVYSIREGELAESPSWVRRNSPMVWSSPEDFLELLQEKLHLLEEEEDAFQSV